MTVYDIMNWIGEKQKEKNRKINIEERRPVAINKLKRQMQYRFVREANQAHRYMQTSSGKDRRNQFIEATDAV